MIRKILTLSLLTSSVFACAMQHNDNQNNDNQHNGYNHLLPYIFIVRQPGEQAMMSGNCYFAIDNKGALSLDPDKMRLRSGKQLPEHVEEGIAKQPLFQKTYNKYCAVLKTIKQDFALRLVFDKSIDNSNLIGLRNPEPNGTMLELNGAILLEPTMVNDIVQELSQITLIKDNEIREKCIEALKNAVEKKYLK